MTNTSPTDILRKEHEKVLGLLNELEKNLEKKEIELAGKNIIVLEEEFEIHSSIKEEKVLFPEIEKFIPREGGPTGVMVLEHKDLVYSIKNFKEMVKIKNIKKMNETGGHIIDILRQHIDKENNILFMIADAHLDEKQKKIILKKFKEIDSKKTI